MLKINCIRKEKGQMLCQLLTHLGLFRKKIVPKSRQLSCIHHITYYLTFSFPVLLFKEFLFSSVQSTNRGPKRVVTVRKATVVVGMESARVRTIRVGTPTCEPRSGRVREGGGIWIPRSHRTRWRCHFYCCIS